MHIPKPNFQLTELGHAFMRLLPAHGEASWLNVNTIDAESHAHYDARHVAEIDRLWQESWGRVVDAIGAIHTAAQVNPIAHLADLAAVARYRHIEWDGGYGEGDAARIERLTEDDEDGPLYLLIMAVLAAAGIPERAVNAAAIYEAAGAEHRTRCGTCQACRDWMEKDHSGVDGDREEVVS